MKVIMITGKAGSGKGAVADIIQNQLEKDGYTVLNIAFGDYVKTLLKEHFDWDGVKDTKGRAMLQWLGTEVMRAKFPTYWADIVSKFILGINDKFMFCLIPDWRFINEYYIITDYNDDVITLRVVRKNEDGTPYDNPNLTEEQKNHISETELDHFYCNYEIVNDGDLNKLEDNVIALMEDMFK